MGQAETTEGAGIPGSAWLSRAAAGLVDAGEDLAAFLVRCLGELEPRATVLVLGMPGLPVDGTGGPGAEELQNATVDLAWTPPALACLRRVGPPLDHVVHADRRLERWAAHQAWHYPFLRGGQPVGGVVLLAPGPLDHPVLVEEFLRLASVAAGCRGVQQALRTEEARSRSLVDTSAEGLGFVDPEERFTYANPRAHELFGVPPGSLLGRTVLDFLDQDAIRTVRAQTAQRKEHVTSTYDLEVHRADGTHRTILLTASPRFDAHGRFQGTTGVFRDITQERQAAREVQRLATAVEQAAEGVSVTDVRGTIQYVNPAFCRISGYAREELVGANPRVLKSGRQERGFYQELWRTIQAGQVWHGTFINRRKDGSSYHQEGTITPVRGPGGEVINFVAVMRDVTRERELEERLRQSEKMEAIGTLAGGVAHDFNNLLAVILNCAQLALEDLPGPGVQRADLEEVVRAARQAEALTRQLLTFSRRQVVQPAVVDLNAALADTHRMLRRIIGEHIELGVELAHHLGPVRADPAQLGQVLLNLVVNARDAMPQGGRLRVRTEAYAAGPGQDLPEGPYAVLTVADTGSGMDAATRARLFEPFFTTKGLGHGTGLGLATVYGIVQQAGGHVRVDSAVGAGSTFRVFLPVVAGMPSAGVASARPGGRGARGGRVLLVEDDPAVRAVLDRLLQRLGCSVQQAASGEEALEVLRRDPQAVDLLVSDVVMPGMGGPDLVRASRALHPGLRALLVSGYAEDAPALRGVLGEGVAFLSKPFTAEDVAARLQDALG